MLHVYGEEFLDPERDVPLDIGLSLGFHFIYITACNNKDICGYSAYSHPVPRLRNSGSVLYMNDRYMDVLEDQPGHIKSIYNFGIVTYIGQS